MIKFNPVVAISLWSIIITSIFFFPLQKDKPTNKQINLQLDTISTHYPPSLQLFYWIEYYSDSFNVPVNLLYGVAFEETTYRGPLDWKYDPYKVSSQFAVGPMQVQPGTAASVHGKAVSSERLRYDIRFNVLTATKYLKMLYVSNRDWKRALGQYHTGRPIINHYAKRVYSYKQSNNANFWTGVTIESTTRSNIATVSAP